MDVNTLRIVATLAAFVTFLGIVAWAWPAQQGRFEKQPSCRLNRTTLTRNIMSDFTSNFWSVYVAGITW
jgi:hypothetical protein